jgi:hypothetical protein
VDVACSPGRSWPRWWRVLESALEGEITDHVGYDKHDAEGPAVGTGTT